MQNKGTKRLQTERLLLRPITPNDGEMVYAWMGDPEVCQYERWQPHPNADYSRGFIEAVYHYDNPATYQWGIELEGKLIGSVSVVNVNEYDQKAVLGYCLAKEYWSKGYTTEAVKEVLRFMFEEVEVNRMEASHSVNNIASGRVLEKAGMKLEGEALDYYYCSLGFQDSKLYGLTRKMYSQKE